jgi:hypothetical protein
MDNCRPTPYPAIVVTPGCFKRGERVTEIHEDAGPQEALTDGRPTLLATRPAAGRITEQAPRRSWNRSQSLGVSEDVFHMVLKLEWDAANVRADYWWLRPSRLRMLVVTAMNAKYVWMAAGNSNQCSTAT